MFTIRINKLQRKKRMKKKNGITLVRLVLIIAILITLSCGLMMILTLDTNQMLQIGYQVLTKQIDLKEEITENEILMGITDVRGEGIIIHILDGKDLIHQEDLIILIDELKNAGSEAISINEQRVTNSTYLYCDGSVILMDGEKIGNPFTIKAIGNSETIYGAITRNQGYISTLKKDNLEVTIEKSENVEIPKTNQKELQTYSNNKTQIGKLKKSNQLIGKSDIVGQGIEIEIEENKFRLTALNFLQLVNDLKSANVEAISINNQRITNMTDIMDISNEYVLVNSIPISSPYTIKAIGNQEEILEALDYTNSQVNKIKRKGNNIELYKVRNLEIEKYSQKKDRDKMKIDYIK